MKSRRRLALLGAVGLGLAEACWGQKASNWRAYKLADGLPESASIAVTVSPQGKVVARHKSLAAFTQLDGYIVTTNLCPETAQGRIHESPGGQLWTVVPGEGLLEFRDGNWTFHSVPEISSGSGNVIDPVPLCAVKQGLVIFLLPDGLRAFNADNPAASRTLLLRAAGKTGLERFTGMTVARDGGLWITGARGLAKVPGPLRSLNPNVPWQEYLLPDSLGLENLQGPHQDGAVGVTNLTAMAESKTNHQRLAINFDGQRWTIEPVPFDKPRQAWHGPDGTFWAMTIDSLWEREASRTEMVENEEVSARQYLDLAVEPGGAFWLATSDGLFRYAPLLWTTPPAVRALTSPVHCLAGEPGSLWFAVGPRLHVLQNGQLLNVALPAGAARVLQMARAVFLLKIGALVFDTGESLFQFQPANGQMTELPDAGSGRQLRALGLLKDGSLCVQTLHPRGADADYSLERFDGQSFEPMLEPAPPAGLGRVLLNTFTAQNGDLWLSGEAGTAFCHERVWHMFAAEDKTMPAGAMYFAETTEGRIWCATPEQVWEFDGHKWSLLRAGFDRINALLRSRRDGSMWVASNSGLQRFYQGSWVENGAEDGLPSAAVRELYEDANGLLWAATIRGLVQFRPEADPDPPQVWIPELPNSGHGTLEGTAVTLTFNGEDKWKYTARERLLFSYRLDDNDWSSFQEASRFPVLRTTGPLPTYGVTFTDLAPGKHTFQVRAMDRNCNLARPVQREFAVILPWYKESRLVLISMVGALAALFFAALAFNRHLQLLRSYAEVERKVTERTRQLEMANRELVHSQKMKALGTLAAGIAHDFNNILSIVKGSAQIIEDNIENPEKIRVRADRIRTAVDQGSGIVKAMLGFSRDSGQESALCDVNGLVENTLTLLGDRFLREVQVRFEPAPALPEVLASRDFIQQILLNFIFNAAESMTKNRRINLATRLLEKLPLDLVLLPKSARTYIAVSVQDFGCGISAENLPRIFEPFFTTKALSSRRGTGLGLSMVYELANNLGAGLAVESVLEQGSTFTLILPTADVPTGEPRPQV